MAEGGSRCVSAATISSAPNTALLKSALPASPADNRKKSRLSLHMNSLLIGSGYDFRATCYSTQHDCQNSHFVPSPLGEGRGEGLAI